MRTRVLLSDGQKKERGTYPGAPPTGAQPGLFRKPHPAEPNHFGAQSGQTPHLSLHEVSSRSQNPDPHAESEPFEGIAPYCASFCSLRTPAPCTLGLSTAGKAERERGTEQPGGPLQRAQGSPRQARSPFSSLLLYKVHSSLRLSYSLPRFQHNWPHTSSRFWQKRGYIILN